MHNWWAYRLQEFYRGEGDTERAENDEFIFNRARIFTIATYQVRIKPMHILYSNNFS